MQIFDQSSETVSLEESDAVSKISFFSEPAVSATENLSVSDVSEETGGSSSSEIAFFDGPIATATTNPVSETKEETDLVSFEQPAAAEASDMEVIVDMTEESAQSVPENAMEESTHFFNTAPTEMVDEESAMTTVPEKNDIYAPIIKAIAEYDSILAGHARIADAKDAEIAEHNARVAELKAAAKKALEERKAIETEISKVKQMKELFSAQLV